MNRRGQAALWEITIFLAVILVGVIWFTSTQKATSNKFESGSQQVSPTTESKPFISLINFNWSGSKENKSQVLPTAMPVASIPVVVDKPESFDMAQTLGVSKETLASVGHLSMTERFGLDIVIILVVMGVGGLLDALGGGGFLFCRRYIMPSLLAAGISTITYTFNPVWYSWLVGLLVTPMMGTLSLGYANFGEGNFSRAVWLLVQAAIAGLFLVVISCFFHAHLLVWWLYILYVLLAGVWGGIYKNWQQFFGDWITGSLGLCSLILYVYLSLQFSL
jgi:hypothetical protein